MMKIGIILNAATTNPGTNCSKPLNSVPNSTGSPRCLCNRQRKIPIIIWTSTYTAPGDEKLALDLGADRYIVKPAPPNAVLAAIREGREPNSSVAQCLPAMAVLDQLEREMNAQS